jgi:hypothetical protein
MGWQVEGLACVHSLLGGGVLFPPTLLRLSLAGVAMGTFFAVGWYGGRLLLHSDTWVSL